MIKYSAPFLKLSGPRLSKVPKECLLEIGEIKEVIQEIGPPPLI